MHVGVSNKIVSQVKLVSELFGRDLTLVTKVYSCFRLHAFLNSCPCKFSFTLDVFIMVDFENKVCTVYVVIIM